MSNCKSCGAAITWAKTQHNGQNIPIDAQTRLDGNITLEAGLAIAGKAGSGPHVSHFVTCPNANKHRKRRVGSHD